MEKRFLLAVVISLVILMVYQTYLEKQQQEWRALHGEQETESQQELSSIETPAATTIGRPSPQQPLTEIRQTAETVIPLPADAPCKEIVVDTPLYQAIFCSHSGRPMSWRLKKYQQSKICNCPLEKIWKSDSDGEACDEAADECIPFDFDDDEPDDDADITENTPVDNEEDDAGWPEGKGQGFCRPLYSSFWPDRGQPGHLWRGLATWSGHAV